MVHLRSGEIIIMEGIHGLNPSCSIGCLATRRIASMSQRLLSSILTATTDLNHRYPADPAHRSGRPRAWLHRQPDYPTLGIGAAG